MNVSVHIYYKSDSGNRILQRGSFPLKRRKKEEVALEFWKWIQTEHHLQLEIEKFVVDGEDMTEEIIKLTKTPLE